MIIMFWSFFFSLLIVIVLFSCFFLSMVTIYLFTHYTYLHIDTKKLSFSYHLNFVIIGYFSTLRDRSPRRRSYSPAPRYRNKKSKKNLKNKKKKGGGVYRFRRLSKKEGTAIRILWKNLHSSYPHGYLRIEDFITEFDSDESKANVLPRFGNRWKCWLGVISEEIKGI